MIGRITTDMSQSSIGMLSAKQIGMETRFINFDLNSLTGSFDDAIALVPERGGNRSFDQQKGQRFIDQFVKAGGTTTVEPTTTQGSRNPLPTKTNSQANETYPAAVFDLSNTFSLPGGLSMVSDMLPVPAQNMSPKIEEMQEELPSSDSAQENITLVNARAEGTKISPQASVSETDAEGIDTDDENLLATPVRKPVSLKFNEWENGFAAAAPINDNFSAVESAIAKYSARDNQEKPTIRGASVAVEPDQKAIKPEATIEHNQASSMPTDLQNPGSQLDEQSLNGGSKPSDNAADTAKGIDPAVVLKQPEAPNLTAPVPQSLPKDAQSFDADYSPVNRDGRQKLEVPTATVQPEAKKADLQNLIHSGNRNIRVENADEPSVSKDAEIPAPAIRSDKSLPTESEIRSFQRPAATTEQSTAPVKVPTEPKNSSGELSVKPAINDQGQKEPIVIQKVDAAPVRDHSILGSDSQLSKPLVRDGLASEETAQISFSKSAPTPVDQQTLSTADNHSVINRDRPTSILPKIDGTKPLVQNHAVKASTEINVESVEKDLPRSGSDKVPTIEIRPGAMTEFPSEPMKAAEPTRLAAMFKRVMGMTIDLASGTKSTDVETTDILPNKQSDRLSEPSAMDVKNVVQQTKQADSLYLRHSYKTDHSRSVTEAGPITDPANSDLAEPKPISKTLEFPTNTAEKGTQPLTPVQTLNPAAPMPTQKTSTFDWNAPRFTERFATEISNLSVNGDLKKFEINPKNLGRLEIALVARGTSELVRIEAESQAARDVIVQHSQAIQEMLRAQGRSDLNIRVDLKETSFAANSESNNQQLAQQDGTETRDNQSNQRSGNRTSLVPEITPETEIVRDEGRYA